MCLNEKNATIFSCHENDLFYSFIYDLKFLKGATCFQFHDMYSLENPARAKKKEKKFLVGSINNLSLSIVTIVTSNPDVAQTSIVSEDAMGDKSVKV